MTTHPETARQQFVERLSTQIRHRNYASSYLARRCRTTESVVESWLSGASLPTSNQWDFLLYVSRDFGALSDLWREASAETPSIDREEAPLLDHAALDLDRASSEETSPLELSPPPTEAEPRTAETARAPLATEGDYVCKISKGRLIRIWLPDDFSRADASRVYAFLLTQADDFDPEAERVERPARRVS
jgi:hypothetical protein